MAYLGVKRRTFDGLKDRLREINPRLVFERLFAKAEKMASEA